MNINSPNSNTGAKYWYDKGKRLTQENCHKEVLDAFNSAIRENPLYAEAYFARGACHYVMGNYRRSKDDLDAAALLGCRDAQFWSIYDTKKYRKSLDEEEK